MKGDFTRFTFRPGRRYDRVLLQQGRVLLDADWNEHADIQRHLAERLARDVVGAAGAPFREGGFAVGVAETGDDLAIAPGRMYVDGLLCELEAATTYRTQPDLPRAPPLTPGEGTGRRDLVYLNVWQRSVTVAEEPGLREPALGGPDTTTRVQTVCQVRVLEGAGPEDDAWRALARPSAASLTAIVAHDDARPGHAGYAGVENRLYRVEIHDPGPVGRATFKWSRDNGAVAFPVFQTFPDAQGKVASLRLQRLGREYLSAIAPGDWLEILDDATELAGEPGVLARVGEMDEAGGVVHLDPPVDLSPQGDRLRVRRWDYASASAEDAARGARPISERLVPLEEGIAVRFGPGPYRTGEHWVFAARAASGTIESLANAPPAGPRHRYAPLALLEWPARGAKGRPAVHDLRPRFAALAEGAAPGRTVTVGDGVHSFGAHASVEEALRNLGDARRILLLEGDHRLATTLALDRPGLVLAGSGPGTRVLAPRGRPAFRVVDGRDLVLEAMRIEAVDAEAAVEVDGVHGMRISGCQVTNASRQPARDVLRAAIHVARGADILVEECKLDGAPALSVRGEDVRVLRCLARGGLWLRGGTSRALVEASRVEDSSAVGLRLGGGLPREADARRAEVRLVSVRGCRFARLGEGALSAGGPGAGRVEDLILEGNVVEECRPTRPTRDATGLCAVVALHGVRGLAIRHHVIRAAPPDPAGTWAPIAAVACESAQMEGNWVRVLGGGGRPALALQGGRMRVRGNVLKGGGAHVHAGSRHVALDDNDISDGPGEGILLGGGHGEEDETAEGVTDVSIAGNRVSGMGGSAVATVAPSERAPEPHRDVLLAGNDLDGCGGAAAGAGGVVLAGVKGLRVLDNRLRQHGHGPDAPSAGVLLTWCHEAEVRGNLVSGDALLGDAAILVRGHDVRVVDNELRAGVWVRDGSERVLVARNAIHGGRGPGVGLGGLAPTDLARPGRVGVAGVEVVENRLAATGGSGVCTVAHRRAEADGMGDVDDVLVARNRIEGCAVHGHVALLDPEACGGVVLREVASVRILDNDVRGNGPGSAACGVLVARALDVEAVGNRISGNGGTGHGWQAGLVLLDVAPRDAGAAALVRDNVVDAPRGHALLLTAVGEVRVHGNAFSSGGAATQPAHRGEAGGAVVVRATGSGAQTAFHDNRVAARAKDALAGTVLACDGDMGVRANVFDGGVLASAATLRTTGNRFLAGGASYRAVARDLHVCTGNQVEGRLVLEGDADLEEGHNQSARAGPW